MHQCKFCMKSFETEKKIEFHEMYCNKDTIQFKCQFCTRRFSSKIDLDIHFLKMHSSSNWFKMNEDEPCYNCPECGKGFTTKENAVLHVKKHAINSSPNEYLQCGHCEKLFTTMSKLNKHMVIHMNGGKLCSHCGFIFATNEDYMLHLKSHSGCEQAQKSKLPTDNEEASTITDVGRDMCPVSSTLAKKKQPLFGKNISNKSIARALLHRSAKMASPLKSKKPPNKKIQSTRDTNQTRPKQNQGPIWNQMKKKSKIIPRHITVIQGNPVMYQCNICVKKFKTKYHIHYHAKCHLN